MNDNSENAYLQQVMRFQFMYVFHVSQHSHVEGFSFLHIIGYKARFWSYTYTILVLWFAIMCKLHSPYLCTLIFEVCHFALLVIVGCLCPYQNHSSLSGEYCNAVHSLCALITSL